MSSILADQRKDLGEEEESDYDEAADDDFNPEAAKEGEANGSASDSSEDEDGDATATAKGSTKQGPKRKRKTAETAAADWDSGDEVTIQQHKRRKRREAEADADSGGEGGLIKTRAQRQAQKAEKKTHRRAHGGKVTVDVDELWKKLSSVPVGRPAALPEGSAQDTEGASAPTAAVDDDDADYITIKRSYRFAGERIQENKRVLRSSAEGRHYLSTHPSSPQASNPDLDSDPSKPPLNRPLRRATLFDPNPSALVKNLPPDRQRLRAPSRADVLLQEQRAEEEKKRKAVKMTTVQKSAVDWAGFVDSEEGLQAELDDYGKAKDNYLGQVGFLGGVEGRRAEAGRGARLVA